LLADQEGLGQLREDALGDLDCACVFGNFIEEDRELVASHPSDGVAGPQAGA
jgi:hypothetical protein